MYDFAEVCCAISLKHVPLTLHNFLFSPNQSQPRCLNRLHIPPSVSSQNIAMTVCSHFDFKSSYSSIVDLFWHYWTSTQPDYWHAVPRTLRIKRQSVFINFLISGIAIYLKAKIAPENSPWTTRFPTYV